MTTSNTSAKQLFLEDSVETHFKKDLLIKLREDVEAVTGCKISVEVDGQDSNTENDKVIRRRKIERDILTLLIEYVGEEATPKIPSQDTQGSTVEHWSINIDDRTILGVTTN